MLDFYLIQDEQPKPAFPEQENLVFAGSLDFETYNRLLTKGVIDSRFQYYSDFRWNSKIVTQMLVGIGDTSESFRKVLIKAVKSKSGLIAYGD